MDEWMLPDELEPVEVWAHRVYGLIGDEAVRQLDPSCLTEHGDDSKPARRGRVRRDERWDDSMPPVFVFEKPFGERAA